MLLRRVIILSATQGGKDSESKSKLLMVNCAETAPFIPSSSSAAIKKDLYVMLMVAGTIGFARASITCAREQMHARSIWAVVADNDARRVITYESAARVSITTIFSHNNPAMTSKYFSYHFYYCFFQSTASRNYYTWQTHYTYSPHIVSIILLFWYIFY